MIAPILGLLLSQATIPHTFVYDAPGELRSVSVAGTFNGWNKDADQMKLEGTRTWKLTKQLPIGVHQYKFVLDGTNWITDPKSQKDIDDGNGNTNSVLSLLTPELIAPASRTDDKVVAAAVKHASELPFSSYDRGRLRIRLQARAGDLNGASLVIAGKSQAMTRIASDEFSDWYQATIQWPQGRTATYAFRIASGKKTWTLASDGLNGKKPFTLTKAAAGPADVPAWPESKVIYQIFPERFANGDKRNDPPNVVPWDAAPTYANFMGGDVAGVVEKIPYLKNLGVGAVYFNPIFASPSNHGYETIDYHKVEPRFGTNQEFAAMTRELKRNGIRTVLDGVYNHTAITFFAFKDIVDNGETSKYRNWFFIKSYPVRVGDPPNYEAWYGFPSMPKINTANPEARAYLLGVPGFWDKTADIAGWRLDVANEVPMPFWREFRKSVKSLGKDRWIIGEIWGDGSQWLKGDQWDSIMGYQFRDAVLRFIANGTAKPSEYYDQLMRVNDSYSPAVARNLMILLGSHDTPRILTLCKGDRKLAMIAATLQLTWVGAPSIYYGDEIGMEGDRDPENRRGMRWDLANAKNQMLAHYRALIAARNGSKALQSGDPKLLLADDAKGVLAYSRTLGREVAVAAVNRSDDSATVVVPMPDGEYRQIFDGSTFRVRGGKAKVTLPAKSSIVFVRK